MESKSEVRQLLKTFFDQNLQRSNETKKKEDDVGSKKKPPETFDCKRDGRGCKNTNGLLSFFAVCECVHLMGCCGNLLVSQSCPLLSPLLFTHPRHSQ